MTGQTPTDGVPPERLDRIMDILSRQQRRVILHALQQDGTQQDTSQLLQGGEPSDDGVVALHHVHLPKLEEADYIEWNQKTGVVAKGSRYGEVEPFLTLVEEQADELPLDCP